VFFGLAMAASTNRWWDEAERRFQHAVDTNSQMRAWPWLAITQCGYAWMLVSRQQPGDRERAAGLLDEVQSLCRGLGMTWLTSWRPGA
jgi:hypothetical protein